MGSAEAAFEQSAENGSGTGLDADRCHRALRMRDARFDGRFFVGVRTTRIFCRPICPAPTPRPGNCSYWPSAAAAQAAGFRPCLRCRPEAAPGTPAWQGTAASVNRALRLIEAGALDGEGNVEALASRLGIGARHLRRLFERHLGTTPRAVARLRRVLFAKQLIDETTLSMAEIAASAGFSSPRRFHACLQEVYGCAPSALRRRKAGSPALTDWRCRSGASDRSERRPDEAIGVAAARRGQPAERSAITLSLSYRPPFAWGPLLDFLRDHAFPGVERVADDAYERVLGRADAPGFLRVTHDEARSRLCVEARLASTTGLLDLTARLRRLFDLGADAQAIDAVLKRAPQLRRNVERLPGLRVPGAFDAFETAVRVILGQQVSVRGATTLAGRLVERWGPPIEEGGPTEQAAMLSGHDAPATWRAFPTAEDLAEAPLESIGLVGARAETIRSLARQLVRAPEWLAPGADLREVTARLESLPGIGPWTSHSVAMRVLQEPDALPAGDLVLCKALSGQSSGRRARSIDVERALEDCRPYRAYGAMRLWQTYLDAVGRREA